ncbi:MAG: hypothetical protein J3R72DRAFT_155085 [Linnemannia gamsii]|nr:MAG: hypothetical protein J3R72DRAFT_155085 [Linnemannia gamsii]
MFTHCLLRVLVLSSLFSFAVRFEQRTKVKENHDKRSTKEATDTQTRQQKTEVHFLPPIMTTGRQQQQQQQKKRMDRVITNRERDREMLACAMLFCFFLRC